MESSQLLRESGYFCGSVEFRRQEAGMVSRGREFTRQTDFTERQTLYIHYKPHVSHSLVLGSILFSESLNVFLHVLWPQCKTIWGRALFKFSFQTCCAGLQTTCDPDPLFLPRWSANDRWDQSHRMNKFCHWNLWRCRGSHYWHKVK